MVDESSADDDTTYNSIVAANTRDILTFAAPSLASGSNIAGMTLTYRGREVSGASGSVYVEVGVNGSTYAAAKQNFTGSYANYSRHWYNNPATGLQWTEADIEGTSGNDWDSIGYRANGLSGVEELRMTQIYAYVEYSTDVTALAGDADDYLDNWTVNGDTNMFEVLDENPGTENGDDGDTTYGGQIGGQEDFWLEMPAFAISSPDSIESVCVVSASHEEVSSVSCRHGMTLDGTTDVWGSNFAVASGYAPFRQTWYTNPSSGVEWLEEEVEQTGSSGYDVSHISYGARSISGSEELRVSQLYMEVFYETSGGPASTILPQMMQQA